MKLARKDLRSRTPGWHETIVMEPCFVLPEQIAAIDHVRGAPERRLWMAVLQDAAEVFLGRKAAIRNMQIETATWIRTVAAGPCGFDWVCESAGLDAGDIRRRLFNARVTR